MPFSSDAPGLVGRAAVWAELTALLGGASPNGPGAALAGRDDTAVPGRDGTAPPGRDGTALPGRDGAAVMLVGPAGIGKSALVEAFAAEAARRGHAVVRAAGGAEIQGRPYGVLRALLTGTDPGDLPGGQRRALAAALAGEEHGVDLLALRSAVAAVLAPAAGEPPLVLVVDEAERTDPPSYDLLLTLAAAITWGQLGVVALFAARTGRIPGDLAELTRAVPVPPLTEREAERLLDTLPGAPVGSDRLELLRRCGGNPLALLVDRPVPAFARLVRGLPGPTRWALTLAATGEQDIDAITRADPSLTLAAWQPAEDAGLVTVAASAVRFRHPLVEQAVLEAAGPRARQRAHRLLAAASTTSSRLGRSSAR
mgnify:CR=1 FL=1